MPKKGNFQGRNGKAFQAKGQKPNPFTQKAHSMGLTRKQLSAKIQSGAINTKGFLGDLGRWGGSKIPGLGGVAGPVFGAIGDLLPFQSAPAAKALVVRSAAANTSTEHGKEFLATIDVAAGTPAGTLLLDQLISAVELGKRLPKFADLWTRTRFKSLRVIVSPQTSTSVSGGYVLAIDPDPTVLYTSGDELVPRLKALTGSVTTTAWNGVGIGMPGGRHELLYNRFNNQTASDAEVREYADGKILLATTTDYTEDVSYNIDIEWSVEFQRPDTVPEERPVAPDPGAGTTYNFSISFVQAASLSSAEYVAMLSGTTGAPAALPTRFDDIVPSAVPPNGIYTFDRAFVQQFNITPSGDTSKFVNFIGRKLIVRDTGMWLAANPEDYVSWPRVTQIAIGVPVRPLTFTASFTIPTVYKNDYGIKVTVPKLSPLYRWYAPEHFERQMRWIQRGSTSHFAAKYSRQLADALETNKINAAVRALSQPSPAPVADDGPSESDVVAATEE